MTYRGETMTLSAKVMTEAISLAFVGTAAPASAAIDSNQMACKDAGKVEYDVSHKNDKFFGSGLTFKNGPGGHVTDRMQTGFEMSVMPKIEGEVSGSVIVAEAKATFGISATVKSTWAVAFEYTNDIPKGKYGAMRFGNWGWTTKLSRWVVGAKCQVTNRTNGTIAILPSVGVWGYKVTYTNSFADLDRSLEEDEGYFVPSDSSGRVLADRM